MKPEINYTQKTGKLTDLWRLNNMLRNNQSVKEKQNRQKWKSNSKIYGMQQKQF